MVARDRNTVLHRCSASRARLQIADSQAAITGVGLLCGRRRFTVPSAAAAYPSSDATRLRSILPGWIPVSGPLPHRRVQWMELRCDLGNWLAHPGGDAWLSNGTALLRAVPGGNS